MKKLKLNILMCLLVGCGLFVIGGEVRASCYSDRCGDACTLAVSARQANDEQAYDTYNDACNLCVAECQAEEVKAAAAARAAAAAAAPRPVGTPSPVKPAAATPANSCDCQAICASDNYGTACSACEASCLSAPATTPVSASTQGNIPNPNVNSGSGVGITDPLNLNTKTPIVTLANKLITVILGLTGVLALLSFIYGGILYMLASVNPDNVKKGKEVMKWSIVGLFIIFSAYAILNFLLMTVLGLK